LIQNIQGHHFKREITLKQAVAVVLAEAGEREWEQLLAAREAFRRNEEQGRRTRQYRDIKRG